MNPKVNYLVVGLFVIVISLASVIFALWLVFSYGETRQKHYLVYMNESVAGLSKDSAVKFNGVNVGAIEDISLAPDPSRVIVKIAVDDDAPVTVDTRATLMSQGLTGLSYIDLSGGNAHSTVLKPLPGAVYAVIPTNPSLMVRLDTTLRRLSDSLNGMGKSVDYLLRDENQKSITQILHNVEKVTKVAADHSDELGKSLQKMPEVISSADQALTTLNTETLPNVNSSLLILTSALPNFGRFVDLLSDNPSVIWRGTQTNQLGPGEEK